MISAAVIAAGMLASCSNKEIVDEQPETDGVSASVLNIVPTVGTETSFFEKQQHVSIDPVVADIMHTSWKEETE